MKPQRAVTSWILWAVLLVAWAGRPQQPHAAELPLRGIPTATPAQPETWAQAALSARDVPLKVEPQLLRRVVEGNATDSHRFIIELTTQAKLDDLSGAESRVDRRVQVVHQLQTVAAQSQVGVLDALEALRAEGRVHEVRPFWVFNGVAVTAEGEVLLALAARPEVSMIRPDRWMQWVDPGDASTHVGPPASGGVEWNIGQVRANLAWSALGLDGEGVTIAIMDTGVDWQHPALQVQYRGYKPGGLAIHPGNWLCTTDERSLYPVDGHGHGTHVAGIAVGGNDAQDTGIGVAPGARWIAVKMLNNAGFGYDSWIHAAFEWLLAPEDNPLLAPDIVNGSWGDRDGGDETFRPDVQALRAAGIVPVFAAGNEGPRAASLRNPASFPEALAVGATDDLDQVAGFSSRGPSPWNETKPEVVAPGVPIRSSLPGGVYGTRYGTSMAAPHVAGLAALVLQGDPTLTVDGVEAIVMASARPLGGEVPNNDSGWGRVDAYRAAALAMQAGTVAGEVMRLPDHQPLPTGVVTAYDHEGEPQATMPVDGTGHYTLALPAGSYSLEGRAFGYAPHTIADVVVEATLTTTVDFLLVPLPSGVLWGQITDAQTSGPVGAHVAVVGTPAQTTSDPQTGQYSLALPAGIYNVEMAQNGYRRHVVPTIEIVPGEDTRVDVALTPAPTLLLVDSGGWYFESQASFFQQALDDSDYVYDLWSIRDLETDVPILDDLLPYEITLWSSPGDAPGLIGAGDTISNYLSLGGHLFLTGQDVGYWDDGLSGLTYHEYYHRFLKVRALEDDAGREDMVGVEGEILEGLSLPVNGPDSAGNQLFPDRIGLLDAQAAAIIGRYGGESDAASRADTCLPYKAAYLAAGLEGLGDRASRAETLDRLITWLAAPPEPVGVDAWPAAQSQVWLGAGPITYTLSMRNTGQAVDQFPLSLSPSAWPTSLWQGDFSAPLAPTVSLEPCEVLTIGVRVEVPSGVGWDATDAVTLSIHSLTDPTQSTQAAFWSKTPAPILLVDDHRWFDMLDRYQAALEANHLPYDVWRVKESQDSPSLARLQRHPVVLWFTAYDWYRTLTPEEEARLATYLDAGGRLLLSSQDYLYTSGFSSFARDYLGVIGYTEGVTATQVTPAVGSPIGHGLGTLHLSYPFENWSDALRPSPPAATAFWGQHGQPAAVTLDAAPFKTAFFAFPLEALWPADMAGVVGQTLSWLSPLGDSSLSMDRAVVAPSAKLQVALTVLNTGPAPLSGVVLSNTVPPFTTYVPGSLEGPAEYDPAANRFTWTGALQPDQVIDVTYLLQVDSAAPAGTVVRNVASLSDESGLALERGAVSRVNTPDLSPSIKVASALVASPSYALAYTLRLHNAGLELAQASLVDPTPPLTHYLPGSAWASGGVLTPTVEALWWTGSLAPAQTVTITFQVWISPTALGAYVLNQASLDDGWGDQHPLEAVTLVEGRIYLPLVRNGSAR